MVQTSQPASTKPVSRPALPSPLELERAGRIPEAIEAWRAQIQASADDPELRLEAVRMMLRHGHLNDALDTCERAVARFKADYDLNFTMALCCQQKAEVFQRTQGGAANAGYYLEDAVTFATTAKKLRPEAREPRAVLGTALFALGRNAAAMQEARELVGRFPKHPGGFILVGNLLFDDYMAARRDGTLDARQLITLANRVRSSFETAIGLDGSRALPYRRLGDLAAWEGKVDLARAGYLEGLARDPARGGPLAWIDRNTAPRLRLAYYRKVLARFRELGAQPGPALADLHWYAGLAAFAKEKWRGARDHMRASHRFNENYLNALYYSGLASFQLGEQDAALRDFAAFAGKAPRDLAAAIDASGRARKGYLGILSSLADRAHQQGDLAASRDLNHALALALDDADHWNNFAFLCRETGRYEDAYEAYLSALDRSPKDPALLNDCALILQYHLKRDLDQARKLYRAAIQSARTLLGDPEASAGAKASARQALRDARSNLQKLPDR